MNDDEQTFKPEPDCAVCLQKCNHPTKLPCGHVFCFLCVKGIAFQSRKCAMCRAAIPQNYLDNPILLENLSAAEVNTSATENVYQWFYEGRNGWWKYDERSNTELETAYSAGDPACTLLLAGTLYNIDFHTMTQVRRSDQTRRRRVRRDTPMFPSKGIAGIKTDNANAIPIKIDSDESDEVEVIEVNNQVIEISDSEDSVAMEPENVQGDDVSDIVHRIRSGAGPINAGETAENNRVLYTDILPTRCLGSPSPLEPHAINLEEPSSSEQHEENL